MLRPGQTISLCVLTLLTIGVVMVSSAGMTVGAEGVTFESILLSRSTAYMALALAAMAACSFIPVRRLVPLSAEDPATPFARRLRLSPFGPIPVWIGTALLLGLLALVYVPGLGREVNGSHRWIEVTIPGIGPISGQPSELAKWGAVLLVAWCGAVMGPVMHRFWTGLLPGLVAAGLIAGFIVLEDLGTGLLIGLVACTVLLAAGARLWHMGLLAPAGLLAVVGAIASNPYRIERLTAFLNPYADPENTGYHMIQSLVAISNGQVSGRGIGHGLQKFGYLPEDTTDFLFAIICEELGVAGAAIVVCLYGALLWSGIGIVKRERTVMLQLLGLGVLATVAYQALINLMVVTGLAPTKGIALPLLSSGGTGWILTAGSLGLLIAMDRAHARDEIAEQDAGVRAAGGAAALPEIVVREEAQRLLEAASAASAPVLASAVSARSADLPT